MAAYLIGHITVIDQTLWHEYVTGVQESLAPFAAKTVFRGQLDKVLAGQYDKNLVVVIEFSDQSELDDWFNSEKYQTLIPLRERAANVAIMTYKTALSPAPAASIHTNGEKS